MEEEEDLTEEEEEEVKVKEEPLSDNLDMNCTESMEVFSSEQMNGAVNSSGDMFNLVSNNNCGSSSSMYNWCRYLFSSTNDDKSRLSIQHNRYAESSLDIHNPIMDSYYSNLVMGSFGNLVMGGCLSDSNLVMDNQSLEAAEALTQLAQFPR